MVSGVAAVGRCLALSSVPSVRTDMKRSLLLRVAATLSLITAAGHTVGTFMPVPPEQTQMHATIATMKATMVPMPVGSPKSYADLGR